MAIDRPAVRILPRERKPQRKRPQEELGRNGARGRGRGSPGRVAIAPEKGDDEQQERADRPELDRLSRERPQERDRIAAPVPDPEQPQRPGDESERHQRPDARGDRCRQDRERNDDERQERRVDVAEVVPDRVDVLVGRAPVEDRVTRVEEDPEVRRYDPAREGPQRRVVVQMRADLRRQDDHDCAGRARERDQGDSAGPTLHARTLAAAEDASR